MSYVIPSVLVYQQLDNPGGALNSTPDLEACIIGPCFNVIKYVPNSLKATELTYVGTITDTATANKFELANQKPGQLVDLDSIQVWFSDTTVTSMTASAVINPSSNVVTLDAAETQSFDDLNGAGTLKCEVGDSVELTYGSTTFTSSVYSKTASGTITLVDRLPASVTANTAATLKIRQLKNDVRVTSGFSTADVNIDGTVTINANPATTFGSVFSTKVYVGYRALRTDMADTIQVLNGVSDVEGLLGVMTDENPLALGCQIALANTVTRVKAVAVASDNLAGYQNALTLIEDERVYFIVPLTQDQAILSTVKAHVDQLSTPQNAAWRVAVVNTAIPTTMNIGNASATSLATSGAVITNSDGGYNFSDSDATFIQDKVQPGDVIVAQTSTGTAVGSFVVETIISNQEVVISGATATASNLSYYVRRNLTKEQQAQQVAGISETFNDKRVVHVQPDKVGVSIEGVVKYLPGYFLACGLAGMGAGFPVQQGFTNIGVAGISDLKNSNFYFSKAQLGIMAEAGTCLFVQQSQGSIPYCRHELTTDISVLEYREILLVKNWDFLSYFYHDKLAPFIGSWNITPDTLNIIKRTLVSSSELLKKQRLPKIGAPLLDYKITKLEQDANSKDNLNITLNVSLVYPNNYTNLFLVI